VEGIAGMSSLGKDLIKGMEEALAMTRDERKKKIDELYARNIDATLRFFSKQTDSSKAPYYIIQMARFATEEANSGLVEFLKRRAEELPKWFDNEFIEELKEKARLMESESNDER
jgi:hypothetical protein